MGGKKVDGGKMKKKKKRKNETNEMDAFESLSEVGPSPLLSLLKKKGEAGAG